jgi:hypothetical protein
MCQRLKTQKESTLTRGADTSRSDTAVAAIQSQQIQPQLA